MINHRIKCVQPYFLEVWNGQKKFEVRINDRNYNVGDIVMMDCFDKESDQITGATMNIRITYLIENFEGLKEGWCVFGFDIIHKGNHF